MKVVYSWNVIDDKDFYKVVDKSVIVSKESGIPHDIRYLFELDDNKEIKLIYKEMEFVAKLTTNINNGVLRSRIRFNSLLNVIGNRIAIGDFMCFKRIDKDVFKVEILNRHNDDIEEIQNIEVIKQEGMYKIAYYTSKYENDESVKKEVIKYHGLNCEVCNFNFEEKYGSLGKDFIELHNLKPITKLDGNDDIDIKTDLICICSNCHRMIHRNKNKILMPEDLKKIINRRG